MLGSFDDGRVDRQRAPDLLERGETLGGCRRGD